MSSSVIKESYACSVLYQALIVCGISADKGSKTLVVSQCSTAESRLSFLQYLRHNEINNTCMDAVVIVHV